MEKIERKQKIQDINKLDANKLGEICIVNFGRNENRKGIIIDYSTKYNFVRVEFTADYYADYEIEDIKIITNEYLNNHN